MRMDIQVKRPTDEELTRLGVDEWGIWEKEESEFDWDYDATETCLILEGDAEIVCANGETVGFGPGDLVTFPRGLACRWYVKKRIKKRYVFE